ncbi:hypothetical protein GGQ88_001721 [Novosphingobium hassiacum]|uniref:Chorismate mutase n=1 Tax=Novosphingobium hassiacum TaxID=173676 RepID=A0A7W5ZUY7_9SPHN|nr:hypothetical protein [Novosphingobium hassiacum]MBB3860455.1 hypothetical protein [Novosphingobium hassiacum]
MDQWPPRLDLNLPPGDGADGLAAIDEHILSLLTQRLAMTPYQPSSPLFNDQHRRDTLSLVRKKAFKLGIPVGLAVDFWDRMLDAAEAIRDRAKGPDRDATAEQLIS